MLKFSNSDAAPWLDYEEYTNSVTIKEGVTTIGRFAFYDMRLLQSVTIPNSVTHINSGAFSWSGIRAVDLPDNLVYIGPGAFEWTKIKATPHKCQKPHYTVGAK